MATDDNKAHGNLDKLYCELISKQFRTYESISSRPMIVKKFLAQDIRMTAAAGHSLALERVSRANRKSFPNVSRETFFVVCFCL
jgi:hypothetical protein